MRPRRAWRSGAPFPWPIPVSRGIHGSRRPPSPGTPRRSPRSQDAAPPARRPRATPAGVVRGPLAAGIRAGSTGSPIWSGSSSLRCDSRHPPQRTETLVFNCADCGPSARVVASARIRSGLPSPCGNFRRRAEFFRTSWPRRGDLTAHGAVRPLLRRWRQRRLRWTPGKKRRWSHRDW